MGSGINRLIATQQSPDLLGAITSGNQARQTQQAGQMNMQAAQQKQERQNRLLELAGQGASPQQLQQGGFFQEAGQAANVQKTTTDTRDAERKQMVQNALALTQGVQSIEEFNQRIQSTPDNLLPQQYKQAALQMGPQGLQQLAQQLNQGGIPASQREFESMSANLTEEERERARRIALGLDPRAVGSSALTISDTGAADRVAAAQETIKAGEERGKLTEQLAFKPQIESAVTLARKEAEQRGDTFNELNQAQAALPGLKTAVDELRRLAPLATSTLSGRAFDMTAKELGFGGTEGATARAKFIATINNQVLPLLKPTFGAAFTVQEGESLKATMGDPNSTPEEKMAVLDAFIDQKVRDIETKQSLLQQGSQQQPTTQPTFLGFE